MAKDPYRYFRIEAAELLEHLNRAVLELERQPGPEVMSSLLRHAHTLKGAARVVKHREIAHNAHALEDAFEPFRNDVSTVTPETISQALRLLDEISTHIVAMSSAPVAPTPGKLEPAEPDVSTVRYDLAEMDAVVEDVDEACLRAVELRGVLAGLDDILQLVETLQFRLKGQELSQQRAVAEELGHLLSGLRRGSSSGLDQLDRELGQVREGAERLRLVPVQTLFDALRRTTRDTAQELGRSVNFLVQGGDVRLDAHVLRLAQGAMVQAVRNAVAHGIEPEQERLSLGKPPQGQVSLEVGRQGRWVLFRCRDDGRGVDLAAVRQLLLERGEPVEQLENHQLLSLLLGGGLSTSATISQASGRGVGLDVVREAAQRLGGEAHLGSHPGQGSVVELKVPISMTSLQALQVEAAGASALIPLDAVRRTLRMPAHHVGQTPGGQSILYAGEVVPFLELGRVLAPRAGVRSSPLQLSVVVVQAGERLVAVGVEQLRGTVQAVLRPMPPWAPASKLVAGAALNSAGVPLLVLDPEGLWEEAERALPGAPSQPVERHLLVVDDSLTTRMLEQSILESAGYLVDLAASGEEGLQMALDKSYDLFLVDVEMPGMDGFTFIETVRAHQQLREIPALLVSSLDSAEYKERGRAAGAQGYIVKGEFDQRDLLERIRRLL